MNLLTIYGDKVIDGRDRFNGGKVRYVVTINIEINALFILAIFKCLGKAIYHGKRPIIAYTHTFVNDPLIKQ